MGKDEEKCIVLLLAVIGMFEFIISLITIKSTDNTVFWVFRIIESLSITVLSCGLNDAINNHYKDGAAPVLIILPCVAIVFIICELSSLMYYIYFGLSSQSEHYIYIFHLIILIFLICKIKLIK